MNCVRTLTKIGLAFGVALIMVCTMSIRVSLAMNPFNIDGDVPDDGAQFFSDPSGNNKELSPINSNTTKIGVIHDAIPPMLGFTNQNPQVDLTGVYIASKMDENGDVWLYFFWERDSNNGSGFIALEVDSAAAPAECDFSGTTSNADLIASCNPWANRSEDATLYLWDQQGNSLDILQRDFTGSGFSPGVVINDPDVAEAAIGSDTSNGELAVNLSATIFGPGKCVNISNILPSTVTGNSDTADYKDTVFFDSPRISNCGTVVIRKETLPDGRPEVFSFSDNLVTEDNAHDNSTDLQDGGSATIQNVFANDDAENPYLITEDDPSSLGFELVDITCSRTDSDGMTTTITNAEDLATLTASFNINVGETVDCTFTNRAFAILTVKKDVVNACAVDNTTFPISITDADNHVVDSGNLGDNDQLAAEDIAAGTYTISETSSSDYVTLLDCGGTPAQKTSTDVTLAPGDNVTCTFRNVKKPSVKVQKVLNGGSGTFELRVGSTVVASGGDGASGTLMNISAGFDASNNTFGGVMVSETGSAGAAITGYNTSIACDDANSTNNPQGTSVSIPSLLSGETVTCTVYNNLVPAAACTTQ